MMVKRRDARERGEMIDRPGEGGIDDLVAGAATGEYKRPA
jgi:hypothetical protein